MHYRKIFVIDCYEKYLLDVADWRELAKIMKILAETIEKIEGKRKNVKS